MLIRFFFEIKNGDMGAKWHEIFQIDNEHMKELQLKLGTEN